MTFQKKYEMALKHDSIKIVTPDWVLDCLQHKKKPEEKGYHPKHVILPEPEKPPKPAGKSLFDNISANFIAFSMEGNTHFAI